MAQFTLPKTWVSGEILYAADLNAQFAAVLAGFTPSQIDGASSSVANMQTVVDPYPLGVPSTASNTLGELQRLRYQLSQVIGRTYWYEDPNTNLETLKIVGPKVNYAVTTNGTDPGLYGMSSIAVALNNTGIAAGTGVAKTSLAVVNLTKSTSPVNLKFIQDANGAVSIPGFEFTAVATGVAGNIYTALFSLYLEKTDSSAVTTTIRTMVFPVQFILGTPLNGLGTAQLISDGIKTVTFGPGATQLAFATAGSGFVTISTSDDIGLNFSGTVTANFAQHISAAIIDMMDISAADTGVKYELKYDFVAGVIPLIGTLTFNIKANGIFYAKELL